MHAPTPPSRPAQASHPSRRGWLRMVSSGVGTLAVSAVLAACGAETTTGAQAGASAAAKNASEPPTDSFPVTLTHRYGRVTIPTQPVRVVTLSAADGDSALALGVVPVGMLAYPVRTPATQAQTEGDSAASRTVPWTQAALAALDALPGTASGPELLGSPRAALDSTILAAIRRLHPDLILAAGSHLTRAQYTTLNDIAPTLADPVSKDAEAAAWELATTAIGQALGRSAAAEALVRTTATEVTATAARYPGLTAATSAVLRVEPASTATPQPGEAPSAHLALFSSASPAAQFLTLLGLKPAQWVTDVEGKATTELIRVPIQKLAELDAQLVWLWAGEAARLSGTPGKSAQEAAGESALAPLDDLDESGTTPTPSATSAPVVPAPDPAVLETLAADPALASLHALTDGKALVLTSGLVAAAIEASSPLSLPWLCTHAVPALAEALPTSTAAPASRP